MSCLTLSDFGGLNGGRGQRRAASAFNVPLWSGEINKPTNLIAPLWWTDELANTTLSFKQVFNHVGSLEEGRYVQPQLSCDQHLWWSRFGLDSSVRCWIRGGNSIQPPFEQDISVWECFSMKTYLSSIWENAHITGAWTQTRRVKNNKRLLMVRCFSVFCSKYSSGKRYPARSR